MMTICKIRVTPFDVLIKNRMANMTSVDCATNWSTIVRSNEEKGDPQLTKKTSTEGRLLRKGSQTEDFSGN